MAVQMQSGGRAVRVKPRVSAIVHIPGDDNFCGDLLSRWVTWPGGTVCAYASVKYTYVLFAGSDKFPTKEVVHGVQAAAAESGPTRGTAMRVASLNSEDLYLMEHHRHRGMWVPGGGRLFEEATIGVCPPGRDRTSRGRCDDGLA